MKTVFYYLYIFVFCATAGWLIEVAYRSTITKKLVNPGFLTGPCLPIYGVGGCVMYLLCSLDLSFIENPVLRIFALIITATVVMTAIEFTAGFVSLKVFNNRLWDYSNRKFNLLGIICPLFSFLWGLICLAFYFLLFPFLGVSAEYLSDKPVFILFIGMYYGIFLIDLITSLDLIAKLSGYAKRIKSVVNMENVKLKIAQFRAAEKMRKDAFMLKVHNDIRKLIDIDKLKDFFKKD